MKLYSADTDKTFTIQDIKKMVIHPFSFTGIMYQIITASYYGENNVKVIGLTRSEHERIMMRLYDKYNFEYYA